MQRACAVLAVLAVFAVLASGEAPWPTYTFDGSGVQGDKGAQGVALLRLLGYHYPDGASSMDFTDRPRCCDVESFFAVPNDVPSLDGLNQATMSFGQFSYSHDIALTPDSQTTQTTPDQCVSMHRMQWMSGSQPRDHVNVVTAWLDLSQVYGSDDTKGANLRTHRDGMLRTGPGGMLPRGCESLGVAMANPVGAVENEQLFCAGDVRANENIMLLAFHTLFVREHNRLAAEFKEAHPGWSDEELFYKARAINIAQYQQIAFYEYSRAIMGEEKFAELIGSYGGHDETVDPGVTAEFSQGAYRFTHGQISETVVEMITAEIPRYRSLSEFFFVPNELAGPGLDAFLHGMLLYPAQEVSMAYAATLHVHPNLPVLDCLRVRDLGLASYEQARAHFGITTPITQVARKQALLDTYTGASGTDLWAGGLVEDHPVGSAFGPVFLAIYAEQLVRTRAADPYWFENIYYEGLTPSERLEVRSVTLADIIRRNTGIPYDKVPDDSFRTPAYSLNTSPHGTVPSPPQSNAPPPPPDSDDSVHGYTVVRTNDDEERSYLRGLTAIAVSHLVLTLVVIAMVAFAIYRRRCKKPAAAKTAAPAAAVKTTDPVVKNNARRTTRRSRKSVSTGADTHLVALTNSSPAAEYEYEWSYAEDEDHLQV